MQRHDSEWLAYFATKGYPDAQPLAAGMEGAVYQLDDALVAKVWGDRGEPELVRLQRFYEHIHRTDLDFAIPRIVQLWRGPGRWVTVEPKLSGTPLDDPALAVGADRAISCMVEVLAGLATVPDSPELRAAPVLGEPVALWSGADRWSSALIGLVRRRTDRFGAQLRSAVTDFDRKLARLIGLLAEPNDTPVRLVHGDLVPANVLVDDTLRVVAVLDFGFLSTAGDPAFDAAVTASIYDMYSERARQIEARIDDALVARFGYPRERLALYRAAYACITSNAYDPAGQDGHFRWCADLLGRDSVLAALDAAPQATA